MKDIRDIYLSRFKTTTPLILLLQINYSSKNTVGSLKCFFTPGIPGVSLLQFCHEVKAFESRKNSSVSLWKRI